MRVLVTGGAGFIGSHLCRHLISDSHFVGIVDRDFDKDWPVVDREYPTDCRDFTTLPEQYDFCYHLASTVGVSNVLADPKECIENIIESTRSILGLGIPGIYFSTSEVYGKNPEPLREDSACVFTGKARWSYAAAKLCGEWLALAAGWKVVRLFNVIGPGQNPAYGSVVPKFLDCAQFCIPIPVYGDGSQTRTFTSVSDLVQILDMLRDIDFDVVNVGSENTVSILDLARAVRNVTGSSSPIKFRTYAEAYAEGFEECPARIPDLTKMRSLIGDFKFRTLEETLKEIINGQTRHECPEAAELSGDAVR